MKKAKGLIVLMAAAIMFSGCQDKPADKGPAPGPAPGKQATSGQASEILYEGKVLSTMDVGTYTYVEVEQNGQKAWAAGPVTAVKPGDNVILAEGAIMNDFHSKGLDRTFKAILFTDNIQVEGAEGGAATGAAGHGAATGTAGHGAAAPAAKGSADTPAKGSVKKAKGGFTVEELYAKKADLNGKAVKVRGKVMKANSGIMGTNWYHIQDGTGEGATGDLMVTSDSQAAVGEMVVASGTLIVDKDLGAGYKYDVIVEKADLKVE